LFFTRYSPVELSVVLVYLHLKLSPEINAAASPPAFESDPIYREFDDNAKAAAKDKLAAKKEILKKPDVADLSLKVQSKRSEIKELKEKMSDYLTQFQQLSGLNEIEGEDGEVRTIVYTARLIKQNSKFGN